MQMGGKMLKCDGCSKNLSGKCSDCPEFAAEMHRYNMEVNNHVHDMFMRIMFGRSV